MLLQLFHFLPSIPVLPPTFPHFSSCPWVIHISYLASTFPLLFLHFPCLFSTYNLDNRHNCPHYFLLLFQYTWFHFPPTTLLHPIVMVKAEYGKINVCMIMWLGLTHMRKVPQCRRMDCHGMWRLYWSHPGEGFACWKKSRTRIRQCLLIG